MLGPASVTATCPGKVLLVGGYLILQEGTPGLVVSTTSRFHSTLGWVEGQAGTRGTGGRIDVHVVSPQFATEWHYTLPAEAPYLLKPCDVKRRNPYVEYALETALAAASRKPDRDGAVDHVAHMLASQCASGASLRLTLNADNDFYSQREHLLARGLPVSAANLAALPRFLPCPTDASGKAIVSKTGLGSSAALVTSVVGAALALLSTSDSSDAERRVLVHDVAQIAHGLAQGKIGSGFDVCAATFGSIRFRFVLQHAACIAPHGDLSQMPELSLCVTAHPTA